MVNCTSVELVTGWDSAAVDHQQRDSELYILGTGIPHCWGSVDRTQAESWDGNQNYSEPVLGPARLTWAMSSQYVAAVVVLVVQRL